MRTALVGQQTICFSSRKLSGPAPGVGRVIERVERDGREFEFTWDDGLVLHTSLRRSGSWDLYRVGDRWRRKHSDAAALIESEDWVAVCFDAAEVETYRREPIDRHPSRGRVGPDLSDPDVDREIVVEAILHHSDPSTRIREALLDPRCSRSRQRVCGGGALGGAFKPVGTRRYCSIRSHHARELRIANFERTPQRSGRRRIRQSRAVRGVRKKRPRVQPVR